MLKQGLYEQVVNTEIKDELRQLPEGSKHVEKIDAAESSAVLTQYLSEVVHIYQPIPAKYLRKTNKLVVG